MGRVAGGHRLRLPLCWLRASVALVEVTHPAPSLSPEAAGSSIAISLRPKITRRGSASVSSTPIPASPSQRSPAGTGTLGNGVCAAPLSLLGLPLMAPAMGSHRPVSHQGQDSPAFGHPTSRGSPGQVNFSPANHIPAGLSGVGLSAARGHQGHWGKGQLSRRGQGQDWTVPPPAPIALPHHPSDPQGDRVGTLGHRRLQGQGRGRNSSQGGDAGGQGQDADG